MSFVFNIPPIPSSPLLQNSLFSFDFFRSLFTYFLSRISSFFVLFFHLTIYSISHLHLPLLRFFPFSLFALYSYLLNFSPLFSFLHLIFSLFSPFSSLSAHSSRVLASPVFNSPPTACSSCSLFLLFLFLFLAPSYSRHSCHHLTEYTQTRTHARTHARTHIHSKPQIIGFYSFVRRIFSSSLQDTKRS